VRFKQDTLNGIDLLYNHLFDEAEALFNRIIAQSSGHPEGYFYLAMVTWSRLASGFWSPQMVREFKARIDRTIEVARHRISTQDPTSSDYFFLGGALGFKGRFELMRGKWLSAFFLATDAIDALKTCQRIDPNNKDVLLGLGTFDYYTDHLSGVLRFLAFLLLHKGNKAEGLRKLNVAAREAIYSGTESKSMLLHIYLFLEEDLHKALGLADHLSKKYPNNPRYNVLKGVCHIRLGKVDSYRETLLELRQKGLQSPSPVSAALWKRREGYLMSIDELYGGRYARARLTLETLLKNPDPENDPSMIAWPILKIGMSHDLEGSREKAVVLYQRVMKMRNASGAQFLAKKLLEKPTGKDDPFIGY
jgi:tetratricopeptide (TPR) repeat protein